MTGSERKFGVALTYTNIFLNTLVMLVYTPFILRYLGQSEYGLYALAMSILAYLSLLDFGFGNSIVVLTSKYIIKNSRKEQELLYGTILTTYTIISILSVIGMAFFYNSSDKIFKGSMSVSEISTLKVLILIIAFNIAVSIPANMFRSILTAYEKFIFINSLSIIKALSIPLLTIVAIFLEFRVVAMIILATFVNVVFLISQYFYFKKHININIIFGLFDRDTFKIAFNYSIFIFIAMVVDQVNWNFGQLLVGAYKGADSVAIYSIVLLFNTTFIMLSTAVSNVLLPKVSKMISEGATNEDLTLEMIKVGRLQAFIVLLVLFGFTLFGKRFIDFWAGEEYGDAYYLTLIIMTPLAIPLVQNLGLNILKARNKFVFRSLSSLVMSFFTVSISLALVDDFGYWGIAISISLTLFLLNGVLMNIYYQYIGLDMLRFWKEIFLVLIVFLPVFSFFYLLLDLIGLYEVLDLIFSISIFCIVCFFVLYLFSMNLYERELVKVFFKKIIN